MTTTPRYRTMDVRPMLSRGDEPLPAIQKHLGSLAADEGLHVIAPFLPAPLIERLRGDGYASRFERSGPDWHVWFWRELP